MAGHTPLQVLRDRMTPVQRERSREHTERIGRQIEAARAAVEESSSEVVGLIESLPLDDRDPPNPTDLRQLTVDQLIRRVAENGGQVRFTVDEITGETEATQAVATAGKEAVPLLPNKASGQSLEKSALRSARSAARTT